MLQWKGAGAFAVSLAVLWFGGGAARGQALVPLGDEVETPLLPAGISRGDVETFGELVYLWKAEDGANVIHFVGDFTLQIGRRKLSARQAVIWMTPRVHEGEPYHHFEILLWRDALVREASGTVTRGPALFVTLNTRGKVRTAADHKSFESSADTPVYREAARIRQAMLKRAADGAGGESPMTVIDLGDKDLSPPLEIEPRVTYRARETSVDDIEGRPVIIALGDVYVFRAAPAGVDPLEIHADAAVVYLAAPADEEPAGEAEDRPGRREPEAAPADEAGPAAAIAPDLNLGAGESGRVEGVYLEGDVVLSSGDRSIRASRLYYDFLRDRALVLDAVFRMFEPQRGVPIVLRAESIRQLSAREFRARGARITTSEFYTPHYHIGAEELTLIDRAPRAFVAPRPLRGSSGTVAMKNTTFNVSGVPVLFWPYAKADISDTETSLRSVRVGYSDSFGAEFESRWALFSLLGFERPVGVDGSLNLDYYSERGPGIGVTLDYETEDALGLFRGYYIHDEGKDSSVGRLGDPDPSTQNRGRVLLRHRQFLPDDWQLTFELSYISDRNFLREYFEPEFKREKEQETLLYLKKQVDNWAFTAHLQYRILDFVTTTERLPEFAFRLVGEPVAGFATVFSENRAGWVRYRPAERRLLENIFFGGREDGSGTVARGDTRQEVEVPLAIGDFKLVPFGSIRGSAWDDTPEEGGRSRVFGTYGVRGSLYAWKVFPDLHSDLLDINGVRHVVKADVVAWGANGSLDRDELFPFDEAVEQIDDVNGVSFGLRQRWQTKRGAPGQLRTVDVVTLDLEVGAFDNAGGQEFTNGFASYSRPENSITRNYANAALQYRMNDSTALVSELNYDLNDGEIDVFHLSYAVERTPRLSYLVGYRYIGEIDSNLLGAGMNYRLNEKYTLAVREEFDLERGETAEFDVGLIRRFPRWYVSVTFSLDEIEDDFGVSVSAWPEGVPEATVGSRRFTGLATSTEIRPSR